MKQVHMEHVNAWLQKAQNDILSAERLLEIEPMILDAACFHCQQAAEKSLKALLCYKSAEIEKTHNVRFLLSQCAAFYIDFDSIDPLNINDFAVNGRYPGDSLLPDPDEAKSLYALAVLINNTVKKKIVFEEEA